MADVTDTFYEGDAFHGYGTQLLIGQDDGSPETYVAVADVTTITPGDMTTAVIEKTHLRSPDAHREKLAGLRDSGPFALEGNWRPLHGSQSNAGGDGFNMPGGLMYLWRTRAERNMKLILSDGSPPTEWPFRGVVTRFQPGAIGVDDKVNFSAEITPLNGQGHAAIP
jgi:Lambda phage tail tube protein, TTP